MKKATKKISLIALAAVPTILGSCQGPVVKTLDRQPFTDVRTVKKANSYVTGSNYQSSGYPSLYSNETHVSTATSLLGSSQNPTVATQSMYHDCGVKVYGSKTSTTIGSSTSLKINDNAQTIDFTEGSWAVPSAYQTLMADNGSNGKVCYLYYFRLEILKNGNEAFVEAAGTALSNMTNGDASTAPVSYNRNGQLSLVNVTATEMNANHSLIDFSLLGKINASLADGTYTLKLTYKYFWVSAKLVSNATTMAYVSTEVNGSGSLTIDATKPTLTLKSNGKEIQDGAYVNHAISANAKDTNFAALYYRAPGSSYYGATNLNSYTTGSTNGWYSFYAKDSLGNQSEVKTAYLDTVKPTGKIYANGKEASEGDYVDSSFSYQPTDSGSGIDKVYYKSPSSGTYLNYVPGTLIQSTSGDGEYSFYALDKAGNQSDVSTIHLDTKIPAVSIKRNGSSVFSTEFQDGGSIDTHCWFNEGDIIEVSVTNTDKASSNGFPIGNQVTLSKASYPGSSVSFILTTATGKSCSYTFHIIHKKPMLSLNGKDYEDGESILLNQDATGSFLLDEAITDYGTLGATINGVSHPYSDGLSYDFTAEDGEEKNYRIVLSDPAGNQSAFTVVIDKEPATGTWITDEGEAEDGGYVAKPVRFEFQDANAVISLNGSEPTPYQSGTALTNDGTYVITLTDDAGNKSTFRITLDAEAPVGRLYADYQEVTPDTETNKPVYFTWNDDSVCKVNGIDYQKNSVITDEGVYQFVLTDKAGNSSTYRIVIDKTAPSHNQTAIGDSSDYLVSKWYDVNFPGKEKHSLATYEEALAYAVSCEKEANVKVLKLDNVSDFTQTQLIADNGDPDNHDDEPRTGAYWQYKSETNPSISLYYFDENLLNNALAHYAKEYVSAPHYFDGSADAYGVADSGMSDNQFTLNGVSAPVANGYILSKEDSESACAAKDGSTGQIVLDYEHTLGSQLAESGLYAITETDKAGNSSTYSVIIDHDAPIVKAKQTDFASSQGKEITLSEDSIQAGDSFYAKSFALEEISDFDPWAVVKVTKDGKSNSYTKGDALPTMSESGVYEVSVFDRSGNGYSFYVYIAGAEPAIRFDENDERTSLSVDISLADENETLVSAEIYFDGKKLSGISAGTLHYDFSKGGTYKVVLKDNFGRTIEQTYLFDKAKPEGTLAGVSDGGKTNQDVGFSYDASKYHAEVTKDDQNVLSDSTGSIAIHATEEESGTYRIRLIRNDDEDSCRDYSFVVDAVSPQAILTGVEEGKTTNGDVRVTWNDEDVKEAYVTVNGEKKDIQSGEIFSEEGDYELTLIDEVGNRSISYFRIDKTLDFIVTSDGKIISGNETVNSDVRIDANEDGLHIEVYKDGKPYDFSFGDTLSEEGSYFVTISDDYGNAKSMTIVIDRHVSYSANVANGSITNGPAVIEADENMTVSVTKDGEPYAYSLGDEITEEGDYRVVLKDEFGNEETLEFQVVNESPKRSLNYDLGSENRIVSVTKDGKEIPFEGNKISFQEDGTYVVTYEQNGKTYSVTLVLDKTAPTVKLNGVEDGGKVDGTVTITDLSEEGTVEVYKDGEKIDYKFGDELKDYGHYEVIVKDKLGNERTYSFDLAFQLNGWAIALIVIGCLALVGIPIVILAKRKRVFKK